MDLKTINEKYQNAKPDQIIQFANSQFESKFTLACSFSKEDVILLDFLSNNSEIAHAFILDTGRLPEETYEIWQSCQNKYKNIEFSIFTPDAVSLETYLASNGPFEFYNSIEARKACCKVRKVDLLKRALKKKQAWITGMRKEQAPTRSDLNIFELDSGNNGIIKINPLANWTQKQVDDYIEENKIPVHPLHLKGYPSIGCAPCTRAITDGEDFRAGRWWWENPESKECGLHTHT